jgi:magnesium-transporting ATPase (P-type)
VLKFNDIDMIEKLGTMTGELFENKINMYNYTINQLENNIQNLPIDGERFTFCVKKLNSI